MGACGEFDGGSDLLFSGERREFFEACRVAVGEQPYDALCFRSQVVRPAGAEVVQRVRVLAADACYLGR